MLKILSVLLISFTVTNSFAAFCSISEEEPNKPRHFTKTALFAEVLKNGAKSESILRKTDGSFITGFDLSSLDTVQKWQEVDGALLISIGSNADWKTISTSTIDSQSKDNLTPIDTMAMSKEKGHLGLIDYRRKLSIQCSGF